VECRLSIDHSTIARWCLGERRLRTAQGYAPTRAANPRQQWKARSPESRDPKVES
jgi:hypothetical protein